ncbi:hypothetical protein SNEBB_004892 [Seison nebaliae]|nr:hypothetical protein SNEBB_004892 [Seison nebaliae]
MDYLKELFKNNDRDGIKLFLKETYLSTSSVDEGDLHLDYELDEKLMIGEKLSMKEYVNIFHLLAYDPYELEAKDLFKILTKYPKLRVLKCLCARSNPDALSPVDVAFLHKNHILTESLSYFVYSVLTDYVEERISGDDLDRDKDAFENSKETFRLLRNIRITKYFDLPYELEQSSDISSTWHQLEELEYESNQLEKAITNDDIRMVQSLMTRRNVENTTLPNMTFPLHYAILCEQTRIVKYIIQEQANTIDIIDHTGANPFHYAALIRDGGTMVNLLSKVKKYESNQERRTKSGKTVEDKVKNLRKKELAENWEKFRNIGNYFEEEHKKLKKEILTKYHVTVEDGIDEENGSIINDDLQYVTPRREATIETPEPEKVFLHPIDKRPSKRLNYDLPPANAVLDDYLKEVNSQYTHNKIGPTLVKNLAKIIKLRPEDPIHYLASLLRQSYKLQKINSDGRKDDEKKIENDEKTIRLKEEHASLIEKENEERLRRHYRINPIPEDKYFSDELLSSIELRANATIFNLMLNWPVEGTVTPLHDVASRPGLTKKQLVKMIEEEKWAYCKNEYLASREPQNMLNVRQIAQKHGLENNVKIIDEYIVDVYKRLDEEKASHSLLDLFILNGFEGLPEAFRMNGNEKNQEEFIDSLKNLTEAVTNIKELVKSGEVRSFRMNINKYRSILYRNTTNLNTALHDAIQWKQWAIAINIIELAPPLTFIKNSNGELPSKLLGQVVKRNLSNDDRRLVEKLEMKTKELESKQTAYILV